MEDAGLAIELVEQPVAAADFDGLKQVTDHVATDIMADESAFSHATSSASWPCGSVTLSTSNS